MRVLVSRITNRLTRYAAVLVTTLVGVLFVLVSSAAAAPNEKKFEKEKEEIAEKIEKIEKAEKAEKEEKEDSRNNRGLFNRDRVDVLDLLFDEDLEELFD